MTESGTLIFELPLMGMNGSQLAMGDTAASLNTILDDVKRFMDENPNEIVILGFNHFWDLKYQTTAK